MVSVHHKYHLKVIYSLSLKFRVSIKFLMKGLKPLFFEKCFYNILIRFQYYIYESLVQVKVVYVLTLYFLKNFKGLIFIFSLITIKLLLKGRASYLLFLQKYFYYIFVNFMQWILNIITSFQLFPLTLPKSTPCAISQLNAPFPLNLITQ